jgi:hypothetical protein
VARGQCLRQTTINDVRDPWPRGSTHARERIEIPRSRLKPMGCHLLSLSKSVGASGPGRLVPCRIVGDAGRIVISSIFYYGLGSEPEGDEYAVIKNVGAIDVNLIDYRLYAGDPGAGLRLSVLHPLPWRRGAPLHQLQPPRLLLLQLQPSHMKQPRRLWLPLRGHWRVRAFTSHISCGPGRFI